MVNVAAQRKESLVTEGYVVFHVERWHTLVEVATTTAGILMSGKTSTGIRVNAVAPRMTITSAPTMIMYGLRSEKLGTMQTPNPRLSSADGFQNLITTARENFLAC